MKMFTMRIELEDLDPPVWRRIQISSTQTLWELHHAIQIAMGWSNCHMHEFIIKKIHYGETSDETDELGAFFGNEMREESEVILSEVIHSRSRFLYVYDFGDDWRHIVKVEKTEEVKEPIACASVIEGGGNGPPEDVGGVWGYLQLLEIRQRGAQDSDEECFLEMLPEGFDPEAFDLEAVQAIMEKSVMPTDSLPTT
ncbi:plasmid pRiA4b ORF-3 family protein [Acidithiobacillus ferriphilus]|uniref:plasmid pRiA4b ORF-3 family protein n=1 Tax=Acidithiobacillus ferriphilus TaxID=1689834 RepID=UPI001C068B39|nr:plasmid pRiA4b ORF-3 family protein [Acidithiobacillus ferriphilus]MBU2854860.1 plasmid pRiA4b ORF-3 family protein [Acidithiobacillus ferriphilus]